MSELHFRINRLEQYIMTMGYPLPSMGSSDDVAWVYAKSEIGKQQEQIELLVKQLSTPMQPMIDLRFKENKIVRYCLENNTDMNDIAMQDFSVEDREQFAQLIGYSLGGYGELSYVTDESYDRAEALAATTKG